MKLTTRSEYALLAMVHLARAGSEGYVSISQIARAQKIPRKYLEQILMNLRQSRCVSSRKGTQGGYRLAKPAREITLAEIIRRMDGALAPTDSVSRYFYVPTPIEGERKLLKVFKDIRDDVARRLERTTLADVTSRRANGGTPHDHASHPGRAR